MWSNSRRLMKIISNGNDQSRHIKKSRGGNFFEGIEEEFSSTKHKKNSNDQDPIRLIRMRADDACSRPLMRMTARWVATGIIACSLCIQGINMGTHKSQGRRRRREHIHSIPFHSIPLAPFVCVGTTPPPPSRPPAGCRRRPITRHVQAMHASSLEKRFSLC